MFVKDIQNTAQIGAFGYGGNHITGIVKNSQPCAETVLHFPDILGIHFMVIELIDDVLSQSGMINDGNKRRTQFHVGDIFGNVSADTAMHGNNPADVPSGRYELGERISFDIHECGSDDDNTHGINLSVQRENGNRKCRRAVCRAVGKKEWS